MIRPEHMRLTSIQVPTYQQKGLLLRAVESALSQDYPALEVVVCDDHSGAFQNDIECLPNDPRLRVFINKENLGRLSNYRHLLNDLVSGEWVVNLDGDDHFVDSAFLSRGINQLSMNPDAVLYMANSKRINLIFRLCRSAKRLDDSHIIVDGVEFLKNYIFFPGFCHFGCIYNSSLARKAEFYSVDSLNSDFISIMKLSVHGKFIISNRKVGEWNFTEVSASQRIAIPYCHQANLKAINHLVDYIARYIGNEPAALMGKRLSRLQSYYRAQFIILNDSLFVAFKLLFLNLRLDLFSARLFYDFFWKRLISRLS
jgi:glycosyltransferase involved in cell wall biosynthesis